MPPPVSRLDLLHRLRRTHPLRPAMVFSLARLDRADASTIRRYQERRLTAMARFAARTSPFYRRWFGDAGVDPRSVRTLADLRGLPLLDRSALVEGAAELLTYPRRLVWPAHSSGTSGQAVTCYRTPGSSVFELSVLERQWSWFGVPRGARRVILRGSAYAYEAGGAPTKLVRGGHQLLVSTCGLVPANLGRILEEIEAFGPDVVEGWPSAITILASLLQERCLTLPVRAVITSSEAMTTSQTKLLRSVFRAPVVDHYGQTERVAMAGSCEAGGYHVFPDYGIVELLPVPGTRDRWEIVGTSLHNWAFPLFRYRTGDQVGPADPGPCPCGRAFETLGRVDGRAEDSFTAVDGRPLPQPSTAIDDLGNTREAQIAQLAPGRFEVRVVPGPGFDVDVVERQVRSNVDRLFGPGQAVQVRTYGALPRTAAGKFKSVVVENFVLENSVLEPPGAGRAAGA